MLARLAHHAHQPLNLRALSREALLRIVHCLGARLRLRRTGGQDERRGRRAAVGRGLLLDAGEAVRYLMQCVAQCVEPRNVLALSLGELGMRPQPRRAQRLVQRASCARARGEGGLSASLTHMDRMGRGMRF